VRKICLSLVGLVLALSLAGCKCSAERAAADEVDRSHAIIAAKLLKYVDADPAVAGPKNAGESDASYAERTKKARDDWHKLVESDKRNIEQLKKALEK